MTETGTAPLGELSEESPDVEGHAFRGGPDPQAGEDDVQGHSRQWGMDPQAGEDDVEGHLSGAIGPDIHGDAGRTP